MDATLHADLPADPPELSPGLRYGLLAAAVAVALLGLTTLDLGAAQGLKLRHAQDERTLECIVASAVFVGVQHTKAP